jgi:hypothetical protein
MLSRLTPFLANVIHEDGYLNGDDEYGPLIHALEWESIEWVGMNLETPN